MFEEYEGNRDRIRNEEVIIISNLRILAGLSMKDVLRCFGYVERMKDIKLEKRVMR